MRTVRIAVPVSLLSVVEVDMPDVGDMTAERQPAQMTVRFGADSASDYVVTVHAPVVPITDVTFRDEDESKAVARLAVMAVMRRAMVEHHHKHAPEIAREAEVEKAQGQLTMASWGQKGEA